jgi:hypothetical protein
MEMPHLRDQFALNDFEVGLPRYYVIEDVGRASEGFSSTWFPHLYRLKLRKVTDNQQFADIFNKPVLDANGDPLLDASGNPTGQTLRDLLSTHNKELAVNDIVVAQAEADAPKSGYETRQFYTLAVDSNGKTLVNTADSGTLSASTSSYNVSDNNARPFRSGYTGYLLGDGFPQNGYDFGHGIQFPDNAGLDDFFLRTDFMPSRLFRFDGSRWIKVEDNVRMNMTNNDTRNTLKTGFINNTNHIYNQAIAIDWIKLDSGDYEFDTNIDSPQAALYVVLKLDTVELAYAVADHEDLITTNGGKIRINLPVIDEEQQAIPYTGTWKLSLCNNREEQRQALSKALKPKADL